ncbi:ribonuclease YeeF family protein [Halalkalibacterium halodurans]|uniref:ribonuclease YeeF family protein n=1 Tax=Halalkalibacterium halodurans TaxID=86665 RepID=UPI0030C8EFBA
MKFLDVNQHLSELDEHISVLKSYGDVFEVAEARITRVINMDGAFKGEGAKGVIYNHAHVQLPTIRSIRAFLISFSDTLEKMKAKINEYEPASNGSVSEDFWKNQLPKAYDRYEETLEEREAAINQATAEVSHILHLGKLQTGDVYNSVDSARKHADTVLEGLYDLDQAGVELMAQVRTKMEELKATIRQVLDWTMTGGVTMKGVSIMEVGGYFANNATLHEKAPEVDTSKLSVGLNDPALADNPALVAVRLNKPGLAMHYRAFPIGFTYSSMMNGHRQYALDPLLYYMSATMTSGHPFVLDRMNKGFPLSARMHQQYVVNASTKEEILRNALGSGPISDSGYLIAGDEEIKINDNVTMSAGAGRYEYEWTGWNEATWGDTRLFGGYGEFDTTYTGIKVDNDILGLDASLAMGSFSSEASMKKVEFIPVDVYAPILKGDAALVDANTRIVLGEDARWLEGVGAHGGGQLLKVKAYGGLDGDSFGFAAKAALAEGDVGVIVPIPFTDTDLKLSVGGSAGSIGGEWQVGRETKIGAHFGLGGSLSVAFEDREDDE